jgi:dienelactone hydrolase
LQATDVYTPITAGDHPVVVLAHETCGDAGCKRYLANLADVLALEGTVVFNPDFGDPQGFREEGGLRTRDLACAVRFAREHAAEFGGDSGSVTLVAHLSASRRAGKVALAGDQLVGPNCLAESGTALPDAFVAIADAPAPDQLPDLGGNPGLEVRVLIGSRDPKWWPAAAARTDGFVDALSAAGYDATLTVVPHATYADPTAHGAIDVGSDRVTVDTILTVAAP